MKALSAMTLMLASRLCIATEWPTDNVELDKFLRAKSARYDEIAKTIEQRKGYRIVSDSDTKLGNVTYDEQGFQILINPDLRGARRATVLIWEMCNAFQRPRFDEMDRRAREGIIKTHAEFGLRMELIEYDSFRYHHEVLEELNASTGPLDPDFFILVDPIPRSLVNYVIPSAHDYIEAQAKSGHTRHYEKLYYHQRGEADPFSSSDEPGK